MTSKSRKLLYITFANKEQFSGGGQCARRNFDALCKIFGTQNVTNYTVQPTVGHRSLKDKFRRMADILLFYGGGLKGSDLRAIKRLLRQGEYTDLFVDSSQLGLLAKVARLVCPNIRIYVFFQNVEYDFMVSTTLRSGDYKHLFWIPTAWRNERLACRYADKTICLNDADRRRIAGLYGPLSAIVPITMADTYVPSSQTMDMKPSGQLKALFVGSYFPSNTQGLIWFCRSVLPSVDLHLTIVGSGMEQMRGELEQSDKLTIHGRVADLKPYYEDADIILLPTITGGGMKVKTAEALMYGKSIVGSPQALEGYEVDSAVATECRSAQDFISVLSHLRLERKFNQHSRDIFLAKYSSEVSDRLFAVIMSGTVTKQKYYRNDNKK